MKSPEAGGGKPHNLDLSSLKPLPEKKEVGSGIKEPESLGLQRAKTPAGGAPAAGEPKPSQSNEEEVVEVLDSEVENMIRHAAMGDPEREAHLQESAKKSRSLREFFLGPSRGLTRSSPNFSIIQKIEDSEDTTHL